MPAVLFPGIKPQFCDAEGNPVAAGRLYSFIAGLDMPQPTYSDVDLEIANANPVVLNAAGQPPTSLFLLPTGYKFRLDTADGVPLWTVDDVPGATSTVLPPGAEWPAAHLGTESTARLRLALDDNTSR